MLTLLFQPGLKFHLDYMDFLLIFDPFAWTENPNLVYETRQGFSARAETFLHVIATFI